MQLELVGCTGAGKSTLAARIMEVARAEGIDLWLADDFALDQLRLRQLKSRWARVLCVHFVALIGCVANGWRHVRFVWFTYRVLHSTNIPRRQQWNQLRKALKQLGRYDVVRSLGDHAPVLVDEGTIHVAHNIFVHVANTCSEEQVEQFALQVPLPDAVVYVRSREDALVERTLKRGHPRIPNPTPQSVARFVRQAVVAFDKLSRHERIAPRTLVIQDGVIVSEPCEHDNPQIKSVLEVVRRAVRPTTPTVETLQFESAPAIHGGAPPEDMPCSR